MIQLVRAGILASTVLGCILPAAVPAWAGPAQPAARPSIWQSCDPVRRVAYRLVEPGHNPHNAFTRPIATKLKPSESCADLMGRPRLSSSN